jgi:hypothetical protein
MNSLSSQTVVETMALLLAERRHRARARHAAYQRLARAILTDEPGEHAEQRSTSVERNGTVVA